MKRKVFEKKKPVIRKPEKIFLAKKRPAKYRALKAVESFDTVKEAEGATGISKHTLYNAIRWWNSLKVDEKGTPIVPSRKKRGRPGRKKEVMRILSKYDRDRHSLKQLREKVKERVGKEYSLNYICILLNRIKHNNDRINAGRT